MKKSSIIIACATLTIMTQHAKSAGFYIRDIVEAAQMDSLNDVRHFARQQRPTQNEVSQIFENAGSNLNTSIMEYIYGLHLDAPHLRLIGQEAINNAFSHAASRKPEEDYNNTAQYILRLHTRTQQVIPLPDQRGMNKALERACSYSDSIEEINRIIGFHQRDPNIPLPDREGVNTAFLAAVESISSFPRPDVLLLKENQLRHLARLRGQDGRRLLTSDALKISLISAAELGNHQAIRLIHNISEDNPADLSLSSDAVKDSLKAAAKKGCTKCFDMLRECFELLYRAIPERDVEEIYAHIEELNANDLGKRDQYHRDLIEKRRNILDIYFARDEHGVLYLTMPGSYI